jgi:signal transduction histidine kinase
MMTAIGSDALVDATAAAKQDHAARRRRRRRLFAKYVAAFVGLVSLVLLVNGAIDVWFSYRGAKDTAVQLQREKAAAAAQRIEQFVAEIERQIGWTTQAQWAANSVEQRRFDYVRLLRQVPAITELVQLDGEGREQLKVSRLAMDVVGSLADYSSDPKFTEAVARRAWFSPVYFRKESEPYMTMGLARSGRNAGVTVAEVNLKLIWDVVSAIKVGTSGYAYVVDGHGRLIAHPDISLVLRNTDLAALPQVAAARATPGAASHETEPVTIARSIDGRNVLTASATIPRLDWLVFVELPLREALAPLYASLLQTGLLLALGLVVAVLAGIVLARRMTVPIRALEAGAARFGAGALDHRIEVTSGDELEALADQFNRMAEQLQESYAGLERKVAERTRELAQSIRELTALGEIGQAVSSTLDLNAVLDRIVARAVELSGADAGAVFRYRRAGREFRLWRAAGLEAPLAEALRKLLLREEETPAMGRAVRQDAPVQIADLADAPTFPLRNLAVDAGYRSALIVPMVRGERIFGTLVVQRRTPGAFPTNVVDLMRTFANQSVLAIQNARLFREIEEKNQLLEVASQHKSQFLANMSHELRTPLNAILGYSELLVDGIYGELGEKPLGVLERVQSNGKHLLGLINDVLDLSKIEAGHLALSLDEYAMPSVVQAVVAATESLARNKGLELRTKITEGMPIGRGDERRIAQVLLNLAGNAIKFTDSGWVEIGARVVEDRFEVAVSDTGPGIAAADQARIFDTFQQVDDSITRQKGGTGLGLAISRRIVEMHGGTIAVTSTPGAGATFRVVLPVRVAQQMEVA